MILADSLNTSAMSSRAVIGAFIAMLLLLVFTGLFKQNNELKRIVFIIFTAVVLFVSTFLLMTSLNNLQDSATGVSISIKDTGNE